MLRSIARWLVLGRPDGLRASARRRTWSCLKRRWEDGDHHSSARPAPGPSSPAPAAPAPAADGFVAAIATDELAPGEIQEVAVRAPAGTVVVAMCRVGDEYLAVASACPHAGGPLGEGELDGADIVCPLHGWSFDARSGACHVSDDVSLPTYETRVEGGEVWVRLPGSEH